MNDAFTADQMKAVLDCPMDDRDSGATSIRDEVLDLRRRVEKLEDES